MKHSTTGKNSLFKFLDIQRTIMKTSEGTIRPVGTQSDILNVFVRIGWKVLKVVWELK